MEEQRREPPILVIARSYQHARTELFTRDIEIGRPGKDWRYVAAPEQVRGYGERGRYLDLGGWYDLPRGEVIARREVVDHLALRGWTSLDVAD